MTINHKTWIERFGKSVYAMKDIPFNSFDTIVNLAITNELWRLGSERLLLIVDGYDSERYFKRFNVVGMSDVGYFVAIMNPIKAFRVDCSYNFQGKKIGYYDRCDLHFIRSMVIGHRMVGVRLQKLDLVTTPNLADTLDGDIDCIVTFVIPNSPFYQWLQTQDVSVLGFQNLDINRVKMSYPYIFKADAKLKDIFMTTSGTRMKVLARENDSVIPAMRVRLIELRPSTVKETFVDSVDISPESVDPRFRCYGDINIATKALCDSPFDVMGMPKKRQTVWDKPCLTNSDCPFYKANNRYPNDRGGCIKDGLCELPIGVRRVSYRKYSDNPFCYGCTDPSDPKCCNKTRDYAFANDYTPRKNAGLETSIAKL